MTQTEDAPEDTFRILIATDNHIGFMEKDSTRGQDSFRAFEEILQIGRSHHVDFVLLAGDMFHYNNPSVSAIHRVFEIMRTYTLPKEGEDLEVKFELLSDATNNFNGKFPEANWMNPAMNVVMPVFTIHGNHDDPSQGVYSAIDIFSISGYINYIGKQQHPDQVELTPLILKKGSIVLDLYALGNIRDDRLNRAFRDRKVTFIKSPGQDEHLSLLMLHQNRVQRGAVDYIPETMIDNTIDLVLWGHEHDCRIDPEPNHQQEFHVTQPGSSVATSLSQGEALEKHVGILEITGKDFHIQKIPLKTVRPFIMQDISLSDSGINVVDTQGVQKFIQRKIESLIDQVMHEWRIKNPGEEDEPLPLVRLRVDYSGNYDSFNPARFGMLFVNKVANPKEIVLFYKKVKNAPQRRQHAIEPEIDGLDSEAGRKTVHIEDLVTEYFKAQNLNVLSENGMKDAIFKFINKGNNAIEEFVDSSTVKVSQQLIQDPDVHDLDDIASQLKQIKMKQKQEQSEETTLDLTGDEPMHPTVSKPASDSDDEIYDSPKPVKKLGGRRQRQSSSEVESITLSSDDQPVLKKPKPASKTAPKKAAPKKEAPKKWPPRR